MTGAITEAALVSYAVTTRVRICRGGGRVAFLRRGHGRATHRNDETWRPLMTAADVPDPSGLDVRRAAQAAADKVLTMLGVPIGSTVDRVEDLHDDPGVFISFGMEPGQPESRVVSDAHRRLRRNRDHRSLHPDRTPLICRCQVPSTSKRFAC